MRLGFWKRSGIVALVATLFLIGVGGTRPSLGDEPGLLGRLFRIGDQESARPTSRLPREPQPMTNSLYTSPIGHSSPIDPEGSAGPRLVPQPRVHRSATEADPLLTRVSLGRSDDGTTFGFFFQVFADGTVIDSEGVHRADPQSMNALNDAIRSADAHRRQGHCGGPPTDYHDHSYIVVYERVLGRLKANSFSYSGNPQGCDQSVYQLHGVIETFQAQLVGASAAATYDPSALGVPESVAPAQGGPGLEPIAPAPPPPFIPGSGAVVPAPGPTGAQGLPITRMP
ncbi:hypothetical protein BH23PLA1_BH23PLA1_32460 [soil metagenome]